MKSGWRLKNSSRLVAGIFLASASITILFWKILPEGFVINENSDYVAVYEPVAWNILEGSGYVNMQGEPAIHVTPGYPFLLAGIFKIATVFRLNEESLLSIFTLVSMSLASVFIFFLAKNVWGIFPALVSTLSWMTYPFAMWLTKQPNSEIPFLAFFYGGFYAFWYGLTRKSPYFIYFLSGVLIGIAMLIRPIAIGAVLVMGVILWFELAGTKKAFSRLCLIAVMLLGNFVALLPWEIWLYNKTGRILPLRSTSFLHDSLTFAVASKGYRQGVKVPEDVEELMLRMTKHKRELRSWSGVIPIIVEELRIRPLAVAKLFGIKAIRSWYGTDTNRFEQQILLIQIPYLVLILSGSRAAWRQGGVPKSLTIAVWLITFYFWSMTILALSILRYMVPALGLLFATIPAVFVKRPALASGDS